MRLQGSGRSCGAGRAIFMPAARFPVFMLFSGVLAVEADAGRDDAGMPLKSRCCRVVGQSGADCGRRCGGCELRVASGGHGPRVRALRVAVGAIQQEKSNLHFCKLLFFSDSDRIQTCNLLIRSQVLYSVKLRSHSFIASANVGYFSVLCKFFRLKFLMKSKWGAASPPSLPSRFFSFPSSSFLLTASLPSPPLFLRRFFAAESGEKRRPDPAGGPGRFP